ncbi:expressed unknown protein [Seminavis robusta]|uniref:Uncharacterized protein n=1 Tax=Seminavis robusta TaxID=568900 RepID=A0A9N8DG13_9STRA|nr:expressed unknown protein [Seminavis robusta]|eukprot:Sro124_g059780.1 n/a (206) ;mRNA; f:12870-13487
MGYFTNHQSSNHQAQSKDQPYATRTMSETKSTKVAAIKPSVTKKRSVDEYESMTQRELIATLQDRDANIIKLESECKRLKKSTSSEGPVVAVSPEKIQAQAQKVRSMAYKGIKSQMKWKPSCKHGTARFSYEGMCDEAAFRAFMGLTEKEKTKGKRMESGAFENKILGQSLEASIRYGYLYLKGNVNISFSKDECTVKITGGYGI